MSRRALSRQAQAFNALLADDDTEEEHLNRGAERNKSKRKGHTSRSSISGECRTPGFELRDEAARSRHASSSSSFKDDLDSLLELFSGAMPPDLVEDVYRSCHGSSEAALEALLGLQGASTEGDVKGSPSGHQTTKTTAVSASAGEVARAAPPCYWDLLPEECKRLILERLSLRDLARAAGACKELAVFARSYQASLQCVTVPPNLSMSATRGLVTAYEFATSVDLSRCKNSLRFPNHFEEIFEAIAAGVADRWGE